MGIRVHLLGRMCLESGDVLLPASAFPGRQGRLAFAFLAAHRHPISREQLAEVMWGEEAPAAWERHLAAADVAANLTRRPFLPGEQGRWIEQKRSELRQVLVRAIEIETVILRDRGDHRYALRLADEAVGIEPFRESCWIELMRVHLAAGNRAEGLRAYQRCRSLLADELGVSPSAATESTYLELLHANSARPASP